MNDKLDPAQIFPKAQYPGTIITIVRDEDISNALDLIRGERLVGFDTETKPAFKKGESYKVSLLQLASDSHALLFRLHYLKDFSMLKMFFEDTSITKAGVAIHDDIKALQKLFHFAPHGFVELAEIAKQKNLKNFGLKGMTEEVLQLTLSKKAKLSNWEASELKSDQLHYAASDAWIGKKLYEALK
jgi:ribonuclease D